MTLHLTKSRAVRIILPLFLFFNLSLLTAQTQADKGGIDAVAISKTYYNSIVKILLYDSAYAKINPAKAYLGRGSGFIVSEDGYIFTNRHVINMCAGYVRYQTFNPDTKQLDDNLAVYSPALLYDPTITKLSYVGRASAIVQVYDNPEGSSFTLYYAKVIAMDTANFDGAIIKIVSDLKGNPVNIKFHTVPIGNSDSISQGQDLCLYAFPAQYGGSMDVMLRDLSTLIFGKHSGYDYTYNPVYGFIKTDAVINSGNSGGAAFGPNNKVVGLATAAFEQTNVGLIGGINAMYDLVALIPDLQSTLAGKGLTAPARKPANVTASLYKLIKLPTKGRLWKANHSAAKKGVANNPILIDFSAKLGFLVNSNYQVPTVSNASGLSAIGGTIKLASANDFGLNFKMSFPSFFKQKNNLIGGFYTFGAFVTNNVWTPFTKVLYVRDTVSHSNDYISTNAGQGDVHFTASLGLSYTVLLTQNISVGVYYGFGFVSDKQAGIGNFNVNTNPGQNGQASGEIDFVNNNGIIPSQTIGLLIRLRHLVLGVEYRFTNNESFYFDAQNLGPGQVNGTITNTNSMSVSLGITIRPKHKS